MTLRPIRGSRRAADDVVLGSDVGAQVLPLAGDASLAVDSDAVRARLAAWTAIERAPERTAVAWQDALLVADRIVALARATLGAGDTPLWLVDVRLPTDRQELARSAGLAERTLRITIDALIASEVLDGVSQIGQDRLVRIRPDILTDAPVVAAVRWDVVRERLAESDAPVARLLVRELARRTSIEARAQAHFISASQRELAESIGYSKASMRRHLDALTAGGLIVSRSRDRSNSWHRLQPAVFGDGSSERSTPRVASRRPSTGPILSPDSPISGATSRREARGSAPRQDHDAIGGRVLPSSAPSLPTPALAAPPRAPSVAKAVEAALTVEVNGVRIALPAGVELTLEQDAAGAMWYRAGALRLGPIRFS